MTVPLHHARAAFGQAPLPTLATLPVWTELADFLETYTITRGRQTEADQAQTGSAQITLLDDDRRFDTAYSGGPYGSGLKPLVQMLLTAELPGAQADKILDMSPVLYWRLGETSGTTAADDSGNGHTGTYGAGCTLAEPGAFTTPDDDATSVLLGTGSTATVTSSYAFVAGAAFTVMGWTKIVSLSDARGLFGDTVSNTYAYVDTDSTVRFYVNGSFVDFTAAGGGGVWPGTGQWVHWAIRYDDSTGQTMLYINGTPVSLINVTLTRGLSGGNFRLGIPTEPSDAYHQDVAVFDRVCSNREVALAALGNELPTFYGWGDMRNSWQRQESDPGYAKIVHQINDGFAILSTAPIESGSVMFSSVPTGVQIGNIIGLGGWPAWMADLDAGQETAQAFEPSSNIYALDAARTYEVTEPGYLFFDRTGYARFSDRRARLALLADAPKAVFTDGPNWTEGAYLYESLTTRQSIIVNEAVVTPAGLDAQTADDSTSQTDYMLQQQTYSTVHTSDALGLQAAQWYVSKGKDTFQEFDTLTLQPGTDRDALSIMLRLDVGDLIEIVRTPPGGDTPVSTLCYIEGISSLTLGPGPAATCTWRLSNADQSQYWLAGIVGYSEAGTTTKAGY